ncbi:RNA polymerase sigma factor [Niabella sp.]|uniref:RNA polymerase sigma factor n=1 Tax=Niabella sp. TaxID=1962976 RepID=UPI002639E2F7|nr:RNA polymerase sigma factor [Niabella sp.]
MSVTSGYMLAMLQKIREGDQDSFHEFYNLFHERLYQYIYMYTRSEWLAEETVQLSFIKIWEQRKKLSTEYSLSTQLFRVAKFTLIDLLRKNKIREVVQLPHPEALTEETSVITAIEMKDDLKRVMKTIHDLPVMQQQVLTQTRINDLSHKETAALLSISAKTVETHVTRAVRRLRKTLSLFF